MKVCDSFSDSIHYCIANIDDVVKKISGNPAAVKKTLQFAIKIFEAIDLYYGSHVHRSEIAVAMKETIDLIVFYGTYRNFLFWLNHFSKDSIDHKILYHSIRLALSASHTSKVEINLQHQLAEKVFMSVMAKENYYCKRDVLDVIEGILLNSGYSDENAKYIAGTINIQQKNRSPLQLIYSACFTITDLGSNILNLKKWNIVAISQLSISIGIESRIFIFVVDLTSNKIFGMIASAGLLALLSENSYKTVIQAMDYYSMTDNEEKEKAYKKLQISVLGVCAGALDVITITTPMMFTLNPAAIVTLGVVSKGVGLIYFLVR